MLGRETSMSWSLRRRQDSDIEKEFGDFEEDEDLDEDFDDEFDDEEFDDDELDDDYDDLDDEYDDEDEEGFRPKRGPRRDWE